MMFTSYVPPLTYEQKVGVVFIFAIFLVGFGLGWLMKGMM